MFLRKSNPHFSMGNIFEQSSSRGLFLICSMNGRIIKTCVRTSKLFIKHYIYTGIWEEDFSFGYSWSIKATEAASQKRSVKRCSYENVSKCRGKHLCRSLFLIKRSYLQLIAIAIGLFQKFFWTQSHIFIEQYDAIVTGK